jgi:hypothetical protein
MQVLLTADAYQSFEAELSRSGIDWLLMNEGGGLTDPDGTPIARENARPEVAWGTSDLFRAGAPLVPLFAFMLESTSLDWFQSPAAGYEVLRFGHSLSTAFGSPMPTSTACPLPSSLCARS